MNIFPRLLHYIFLANLCDAGIAYCSHQSSQRLVGLSVTSGRRTFRHSMNIIAFVQLLSVIDYISFQSRLSNPAFIPFNTIVCYFGVQFILRTDLEHSLSNTATHTVNVADIEINVTSRCRGFVVHHSICFRSATCCTTNQSNGVCA